MIQRLANNDDFFDKMKNKIRRDSAIVIQRFWRSIALRFRKYRNALKVLKHKKTLRMLLRWSRLWKSNKKPNRRRVPSKPQNLDIPDGIKKTVTTDISAVKFAKVAKRRMTNIKGSGSSHLLIVPENLINVITKGKPWNLIEIQELRKTCYSKQ